VSQQGTVVTRAAWEEAGGFDPAFRRCGDSEFLARLCVRGQRAVYMAREVAAFRLHPGQMTKDRGPMQAERDEVDRKLALRDSRVTGRRRARFWFRANNATVYAERIWRHGWIPFETLLERG
jgi:hypothetical protein